MKTHATILIMAALVSLIADQGICQQVIELKPPTEETITGVIKKIDGGESLIVSTAKGRGQAEDIFIILDKDSKVTIGNKVIRPSHLRVGQTVKVTYTTQNTVPIVNNVPVGEETLRFAKSISVAANEALTALPRKVKGTVVNCGREVIAGPDEGSKVAKAFTLAEIAKQAKAVIEIRSEDGKTTKYVCKESAIDDVGSVKVGDRVECDLSADGKTIAKIRKLNPDSGAAPDDIAKVIDNKIDSFSLGMFAWFKSCSVSPDYDFSQEKVQLPKDAPKHDLKGPAAHFEAEWGGWEKDGSPDVQFRSGMIGKCKAFPKYIRDGTEAKVKGEVYVFASGRWIPKK